MITEFQTEDAINQTEDTVNQTSEEIKNSLLEQIKNKNDENKESEDAVQKQETDEIHVEESSRDSEQMDKGIEEEKGTDNKEEKKSKKLQFKINDEILDVDENAIVEMKADGSVKNMTLKEMRDAAAGGIAIRNRMRQLSDDKKKLHQPYKDFAKLSETDPLLGLKKIFSVIKQIDPEADYKKYLSSLGKQAQKLSQMSSSERKAYELEKELDETRENLTESERIAKIQSMKQDLIEDFGLNEEQIYQFGQQILNTPDLAKTIETEDELFDRIGELADEIERQHVVFTTLQKFDGNIKNTDPLVFELSALLEKNPDFDERDLEEIAEEITKGLKKSKVSKVLSKKSRSKALQGIKTGKQPDYSKMNPKEALMSQILEKKKKQQN